MGVLDMQVLDQLALVDRHALALGNGRRMRLDDLARPVHLLRRGRKDVVGDREGARMNERLAVEAHVQSLPAGIGQAFVVAQVEMHAVEDRETICAGGQKADAEAGDHGHAVAGMAGVEILGQIRGAHHQALQPRRGARDLLDMKHADGRFHHRPDAHLGRRAGHDHDGLGLADRVGAFDLRQQNRIGAAGRGRGQILVAPGRRQGIDADHQLAIAVSAHLQRAPYVLAGLDLHVGRD